MHCISQSAVPIKVKSNIKFHIQILSTEMLSLYILRYFRQSWLSSKFTHINLAWNRFNTIVYNIHKVYSYSNQVIRSHLWVISRNIYLDWLPRFLHFSIKGASTFDLWLSERKRQIMEPCFIGTGVEGRWQRKHLDETGWLSAQDGQARQLDRQASSQAGRQAGCQGSRGRKCFASWKATKGE